MSPTDRAASQKAAVLGMVKELPSASRREVASRDARALVAAAAVALLVFVAVGGPQATMRPPWLVGVTGASWAVVALFATRIALGRGRSMLGAPRALLASGAVLVPILLAVTWFAEPSALVLGAVPHPYMVDVRCFAITLAMGIAPLVAFLATRREGDPLSPSATGAALGAAAGAWGSTLIDLHCEMVDPLHVTVGHLFPVLVLAAAGAVLGQLTLAIRVGR
jgi:hypothetical protein